MNSTFSATGFVYSSFISPLLSKKKPFAIASGEDFSSPKTSDVLSSAYYQQNALHSSLRTCRMSKDIHRMQQPGHHSGTPLFQRPASYILASYQSLLSENVYMKSNPLPTSYDGRRSSDSVFTKNQAALQDPPQQLFFQRHKSQDLHVQWVLPERALPHNGGKFSDKRSPHILRVPDNSLRRP